MVFNSKKWLFIPLLVALVTIVVSCFVLSPVVIIVGCLALFFVVMWFVNKEFSKKYIDQLQLQKKEILNLQRENKELLNRHLDVTEVKNIFKVALLEVDAVDVRTYKRDIKENKRFVGVLRIKVQAQYGIDVECLKFRRIGNVLQVADINPRFLSFVSRTMNWEHKETLELVTPAFSRLFNRERYWRTYSSNDKITMQLADQFQNMVEIQMNEKGPENAAWIKEPLMFKVRACLQILFKTEHIEIVEKSDESFYTLESFLENDKIISNL